MCVCVCRQPFLQAIRKEHYQFRGRCVAFILYKDDDSNVSVIFYYYVSLFMVLVFFFFFFFFFFFNNTHGIMWTCTFVNMACNQPLLFITLLSPSVV